MFLLAIFIISILVSIGSFAFTSRRKEYAIISSAVVMVLTVVYSLLHFASSYSGGYVSVSNIALSTSTGIYFSTAVTGFTDWLLILGTVIIFIAALITKDNKDSRTMYSYILIAGAGLYGILISRNFLFFYIFWEVVLIPVYFMIGQFGGKNKDSASMKFFVYTQFGSLFILLAILTLYNFYSLSHSGVLTFQMSALLNTSFINTIPVLWKDFLIFGFLFGFLVKMPSFPVHSWLPDSYESAPFPGTVILAGGLSVMGGYGLFGILLPVSGIFSGTVLYVLILLGIISLIYFALTAMFQQSLKRMMAFASAAAMGFVTIAFGAGILEAGTISASAYASANIYNYSTFYSGILELSGGMFQIVAHGLIMAMIFATLYFITEKTGKQTMMNLGGIFREAPVLSSLFLAGLLASLGLPGLAGFIGEFSIFVGSFQAISWIIFFLIFGMIITASYHIWAAQKSLFGPYNENLGKIGDINSKEISILMGLLIMIFIIGIVPNLVYVPLVSYIAHLGGIGAL